MRIGLIVPSYGQFDYVLKTVNSFFEHTPGTHFVYVIDDASPDWETIDWTKWPAQFHVPRNMSLPDLLATKKTGDEKVLIRRYEKNGGLTRSWNAGLSIGGKLAGWDADYIICGNSDILFTPRWYEPLINALESYALVGPVTNAPGRVLKQNVKNFFRSYQLTDSPAYLADLAKQLREIHGDSVEHIRYVNGFFTMAKKETWWNNAHSSDHVINPMAKMTTAAYEIQDKLRKKKQKVGLVPSSFIFHYRAVSRGKVGLQGRFGAGAWRPKPTE